jgi:hypothetical protein
MDNSFLLHSIFIFYILMRELNLLFGYIQYLCCLSLVLGLGMSIDCCMLCHGQFSFSLMSNLEYYQVCYIHLVLKRKEQEFQNFHLLLSLLRIVFEYRTRKYLVEQEGQFFYHLIYYYPRYFQLRTEQSIQSRIPMYNSF